MHVGLSTIPVVILTPLTQGSQITDEVCCTRKNPVEHSEQVISLLQALQKSGQRLHVSPPFVFSIAYFN
jgi:hypothetical protein